MTAQTETEAISHDEQNTALFLLNKKRKTAERAIDKPSHTETLSMQTMLRQMYVAFVSLKRTRTVRSATMTGFRVLYVTCGCTPHVLLRLVGIHLSMFVCIAHTFLSKLMEENFIKWKKYWRNLHITHTLFIHLIVQAPVCQPHITHTLFTELIVPAPSVNRPVSA